MKTRRITRTRQVPHTIGGITHLVDEEYTVEIPVPPRDWDHIILTAVTALAGILVLVAVVWSTANIGALLSRATIAPAAYAAAIAFDLAWIMCMAVEWLARYDRLRASMPRRAGHIALAIAMLAVAAHGWLNGERAIGLIGAAVSGLVKGLWTVVLSYYAAPLDPRTQAWVEQQLAEAGAQQALIPVQRQLLRSEGAVKAERHSLGRAQNDETQQAQNRTAPDIRLGYGYTVQPADPTCVSTPAKRPSVAKQSRPQPPSNPAGPVGDEVGDVAALLGKAHAPIVYFIGNGNRVKIGTTQNLKRRLAALTLRPADVIRVEHGDQRHERALHRQFAEQRTGNTEWFDLTGALATYLGVAAHASPDAPPASPDAQEDAADAGPDAEQVRDPEPPIFALPQTTNKTELIKAASSMLRPGASAADIAHLLAQRGHAVDTAYVRTVLSRNPKPEDGIGKGGGGYA